MPPISASEAAPRIDWLSLSPDSQRAIREIVVPLALGWTHPEIAAALRISRTALGHRLTELRREIRAQLDKGPS